MNPPNSDQNNNQCNMVGLLGILIQVALGVLSFSVLLIKRYRETPPRPWKIWLFDTSKQGISQMFAHFMNLTISIALTYEDSSSDECLWYFTTNILDNTIGVFICIFCLVMIEKRLISKGKPQYVSGNYYTCQKVCVTVEIMNKPLNENHQSEPHQKQSGKPNELPEIHQAKSFEEEGSIDMQEDHKAELVVQKQIDKISDVHLESQPSTHSEMVEKININYKAWLVQLLIWISIVIIGKSILFGFQFGIEDALKNFTFALMGWIEEYQVLQLVVVIVIGPVIMNGLAFWVQDNFLKKHQDTPPCQPHAVQDHSQQKDEQKYEIM